MSTPEEAAVKKSPAVVWVEGDGTVRFETANVSEFAVKYIRADIATQAVTGTPVVYLSPKQIEFIHDPEGEFGVYIPMRKTPASNFTIPLYASQPAAQPLSNRWQPISTAPHGEPLAVRWINRDGNECHDFDYLEDDCWMHWTDHAQHVESIGGHGVSEKAPYTHWMSLCFDGIGTDAGTGGE